MNDPTWPPASGPLEISERLWDRFERTGDSAQLDEAIESLRDATNKQTLIPTDKPWSSRTWARRCLENSTVGET